MKSKLRIVMAQLNFTVGDIDGNLKKHLDAIKQAKEMHADLIIFPELSITGYPPEDLLHRHSFIEDANRALKKIMAEAKNLYCIIGIAYFEKKRLRNGCVLVHDNKILASYAKQRLPNYAVFDEARYFTPGKKSVVVNIEGLSIGLLICEDIWSKEPMHNVVNAGAKLVIVVNASPFVDSKHRRRRKMLAQRATENNIPIIYACSVGGQDELIFDGDSMAIDANGELCAYAGLFKENFTVVEIDVDDSNAKLPNPLAPEADQINDEKKIYEALVLALRDYVEKNRIPSVIIGISGGVDSALTLAIAVDALGKDRVHAVMLPSRYTSELSIREAKTIIENFDVKSEIISIEPAYQTFLKSLSNSIENTNIDLTEQNIQARCRMIILMALANKTNSIVLNTGNRSELSVGYCTQYGDMAGGFAVIKDVYKTLVYELANYRNSVSPVIPEATIQREPSAELAPNQLDQDSLPPYDILDGILQCYMDLNQSIDEIVAQGFDRTTVIRVVDMVRKNQYKRTQAPVGPRIHRNSFGKGWRYPITNGYKG